jgi:hypothetical protein
VLLSSFRGWRLSSTRVKSSAMVRPKRWKLPILLSLVVIRENTLSDI